jgi:4,5-dihydroxyphthalate decarboxylase
MVAYNYDHLAPLACGDVAPEGIDLDLDRTSPMVQFLVGSAFEAGEMSFGQYLIRLSQGERAFVGLPVFVNREFCHRCFFVPRHSPLHSLHDLEGRRVGTNAWPDTGNTWSRATLRDEGVRLDRIRWWVGPYNEPAYDSFGNRPRVALPPNVERLAAGRTLLDMLLAGELDALMYPVPPPGFYAADSPLVRLLPDYRRTERAWAQRAGFCPGHHIVALRRDLFEREPWVAPSLYHALEQSRQKWQEARWDLSDTSPWLLPDLEDAAGLLGRDWRPYGVEPNRRMIQTLCDEELAQGLISEPLDPAALFADFERAMQEAGPAKEL